MKVLERLGFGFIMQWNAGKMSRGVEFQKNFKLLQILFFNSIKFNANTNITYKNYIPFKYNIQYIDIHRTDLNMDLQLTLPEPNINCNNGYTAELQFSALLPSVGMTNKYDPQGQFIAIGCNNGQKILYSIPQNKIIQKTNDDKQNPVTCIKWRPTTKSKKKVIGVCIADGRFQYRHVPSMKQLFTITQNDNSILCCDFDEIGQKFATAGKDCNIRIYDQSTKSISCTLGRAEWNYSGHSNRIFSLKFIDQNTLISGGWDNVIHLWDIRHSKSVKSFYGPHIAGDALDFQQNVILTGNYATKDQLQLFDIRNFHQLQAINWPCDKQSVAYVYSACFSKFDKGTIVAGASGVNQVRIFTKEQKQTKYGTSVKISDMKQGCYSVDAASKSRNICFVTAKQGFFTMSYKKK